MRMLLAASTALIAFCLDASAETRDHSGFTGVGASDRIRVEITVGPQYAVNVTGSDASRVRTRIEDGSLRISDARRPWFGQTPRLDAQVRITMPRVDSLAASRGAEVRASGVTATDLALSASMGGELDVSGACTAVSASVSMGGVIDAEHMRCETAQIAASMGGVANVYARDSYRASASMGGEIDIAGEASRGDVSTSMGGAVQHR